MVDRHRRVSRILLLDEQDRLLLMLTDFPRLREPHTSWITPGGGVDPGESHRDGAIRELWEETGLRVADPGEPVWSTDKTEDLADGTVLHSHSEFYLVRTAAFEPVQDHWMADEFVDIHDVRWWTLAQLRVTQEPVAPTGLVAAVEAALMRNRPDEG